MKQNTKFLWMYVAILFSFALILIIFAGLSRNTENEQKEGMKEDIATLSAKNTELANQLSQVQKELGVVSEEKNALAENNNLYNTNELLLVQAISEYDGKKIDECALTLSKIDSSTLTQTQTYVYTMIKNEIEK